MNTSPPSLPPAVAAAPKGAAAVAVAPKGAVVAVAPKGALTQAEKNYNLLKRQMRHQARQARLENEQIKARERRLLRENVLLTQRNRRNDAKIAQLKQMWNETQYRIRTYEQQLLRDQTNHMLRMQLQVEKQRRAALAAGSSSSVTSKNDDYILKRNIPCWGCII
jgi:hypothetical protein